MGVVQNQLILKTNLHVIFVYLAQILNACNQIQKDFNLLISVKNALIL